MNEIRTVVTVEVLSPSPKRPHTRIVSLKSVEIVSRQYASHIETYFHCDGLGCSRTSKAPTIDGLLITSFLRSWLNEHGIVLEQVEQGGLSDHVNGLEG